MSDASPYLRSALYEHLTGGDEFNQPATLYLALYASGVELSVGGYARQVVSFAEEASPGAGVSDIEVQFGPLDDTGLATHFAIHDQASGGNRLTAIKALGSSAAWADGGTITFPEGAIAASFV